ncbi:MAG: hypothetical protein IBX69_07010 [Anaerolineales bacterium]|nr:hypothetical protein [Anaerolineales bacterium]
MNISPDEAEDSLDAIQSVMHKTRRSITGSGSFIFLIITGVIYLVGFLATQFLLPEIAVYIWIGAILLGSALSIMLGSRLGSRVRGASTSAMTKRAILFLMLLGLYCIAVIAVAHPVDEKQVTMIILLFIMIAQLSIGMLTTFSSFWWALPITGLALIGYFFFIDIFYLWMALLVGGGMIMLGLYIRLKW